MELWAYNLFAFGGLASSGGLCNTDLQQLQDLGHTCLNSTPWGCIADNSSLPDYPYAHGIDSRASKVRHLDMGILDCVDKSKI